MPPAKAPTMAMTTPQSVPQTPPFKVPPLAQNPMAQKAMGMSMGVGSLGSEESIANYAKGLVKKMSPEDINLAHEFLSKFDHPSPNVFMGIRQKVAPMFRAMGIHTTSESNQLRILNAAKDIIGPKKWSSTVESAMSGATKQLRDAIGRFDFKVK